MNSSEGHVFKLFVYGTLMPGESNYGLIERYVRSARPGCIEGVLVDLGAFPALIAGDGIVEGMLLELASEAMAVTDRLEGFHPEGDHSLYLRKEVMAQFHGGEQVTAWTYEFSDPGNIADRPKLVVGRQEGQHIFAWQSRCDSPDDQ